MFENRRNYGEKLFPPVIKGIIIANVAVFVLIYMVAPVLMGFGDILLGFIHHYFVLQPLWIFTNSNTTFLPWQLVSYQFLHGNFLQFDSGFFHLLFNMFGIWMFGRELETLWGPKKFLLFYLISGVGAGITQLLIPFIGLSSGPTVGASGALYGLLLAFGMTFPNREIFMFPLFIPIKAKYFIVIFAVMGLLMGVSNIDNVAHFAHLGGAATGFILLMLGKRIGMPTRKMGEENYSNNVFSSYYREEQTRQPSKILSMSFQRQNQPVPQIKNEPTVIKAYTIDGEIITQQKIDEILDKISAFGYQKLTEREKFILTELSKKI